MSGLGVRYHRDGRPVEPSLLWSMLEAIPYRALDGMWVHSWETLALGYAKLTITPEEVDEVQPLLSPRTGCAIIADVRLDNREELLACLPVSLPVTTSDAALILHAYEAWGADAIRRLFGDFALAIWDPRQQQLVCARDSSGQRGLFYYLDASTFAAASEIHQLFQDPAIPIQPNDDRIKESLTPCFTLQNEKQTHATYYAGIYAIPAGQILTVSADDTSLTTYWELEPREIRYKTDTEYAEHFRELLATVVAGRLRSIHPVGAMLSGGLDSSSIVATAQQLYRQGAVPNHGFVSFSTVFDGLDCDERPYIEELQRMYGFEARYIEAGFQGRLELEPEGFRESPNMGIREGRDALFGAAADAAVRVMLTGHTADACVSGSRQVLDALIAKGSLREFRSHFRAYRRVSSESLLAIIAYSCVAPLLPRAAQSAIASRHHRHHFKRLKHRMLPNWMPDVLRTDLAERQLHAALQAEKQRLFSNPSREDDFRLLYPPEVTRHPAPWPTQMCNPYTDRRLHEYLLGIPPEQRFRPHVDTDSTYAGQKTFVRRAMQGILPEPIRGRTSKTSFKDVWEIEIDRQWAVYEAAFRVDAPSQVIHYGYVDAERFRTRLREIKRGIYGPDFAYIMHILQLETWLRTLQLPRHSLTRVPEPWNAQTASGSSSITTASELAISH